MVKKIIALIICVATVACTVTAFATETDWQKKELLTRLNLIDSNGKTYNDFIGSLSGFLFENPESMGSVENIARSTGMIGTDEEYDGGDILTVNRSLEMAVVALGYNVTAENSENYIRTASTLGLTKGVNVREGAYLSDKDALNILYNMLDVEPMIKYFNGEYDKGYVIEDGATLLSVNRSIYSIKGIMTSTQITSIYGDEYIAGVDCIMIDDSAYFCETNEFDNLLGKNVIAYVKENETGDYELLYMYEDLKSGETVNIDCEEIIEIGDGISSITYYGESGREKTVKISKSLRVIYNGKFIEEYEEDDFLNGNLELTDNDRDGKYDIIRVTAYQTVVVETVDEYDMIIKNRYKFADRLPELNLYDPAGDKIYKFYNTSGEEIPYYSVKTDNILSVAASKDGMIINVYVSDTSAVTGMVTRIDDYDEVLTIDNTEYKMSADFKKYIADTGKVIKLGKNYTFLMNYFGEISYMKEETKNDYSMLLKVYADEDTEICYGVFMDMNGDWYTYPISDKVKIDGSPYTSANAAVKIIKNNKPQIVILRLNSKNEIAAIDYAANYTGTYTEEFCKKSAMQYIYRAAEKFFQTGTDTIYPEEDAKVIVFPAEDIYNKENWQVKSFNGFFRGDTSYTIECYNPDRFMFTDLIAVTDSPQLTQTRASKSLYIITGFEERLIDDEVLPVIIGNVGEFRELSFTGNESGVFDGLKIGDVVNFALDSKGDIEYVSKVYSLENFVPTTGSMYSSVSMHAGTVEDIDAEKGRMAVNCGTSIKFNVNPGIAVTVYDSSRKKCDVRTLSVLNPGDKVLMRMPWGKIEEIVCIRGGK